MKKYLAIILVLLICLAGCTVKKNETPADNDKPQLENTDKADVKTENDNNEDKPQKKPEIQKEETPVATKSLPEIVTVNKGVSAHYEWAEDDAAMKARVKTSYIVLSDKEREKYPALAKKLDEVAALCMNSAETEFENLIFLADEQLSLYDGFNTQTSTLDMHIRRSDSNVFSTISDSYMDTMYIEDFRAIHGSNYDTKSGEELIITDVVKDMPEFAGIVEKRINSYMWSGDLYSETAVKDYFENRTPDGISWSLDYNGVTIYFNRGDIADPALGFVTVTVPFEEYPELFEEKYTQVPDTYVTKLLLNYSNFLDINNDGRLEELVVSGQYDEEYRFYSDIYLVTSDDYYEENFFSYGYNPYYIKTADGRHFIYLFGEGSEDWNRLMSLYVYEITDGKIKKMGEMPVAPHHEVSEQGVDEFDIPTDPENMYFDMFSQEPNFSYPAFTRNYEVSNKGMPQVQGETEEIPTAPAFAPETFAETELSFIDFFETRWYGYSFVDGETGMPTLCDNDKELVLIEFFNTGKGLLTNAGQYTDFLWSVEEKKGVYLDMNGEYGYYGTVYTDDASRHWMMIQIEGNILWLYKDMPDGDKKSIDTDNLTEFAKVLDLDSCKGNPDFAVAFLGYGEDLWEHARLYIEDTFSSLDEELITQTGSFSFEGDEWYLVIPLYNGTIDVTDLNTGETTTVYQAFPFTVKCNLSSLHSNVEITTSANDRPSFRPQMGGDGRLVTSECVWDITEYN